LPRSAHRILGAVLILLVLGGIAGLFIPLF